MATPTHSTFSPKHRDELDLLRKGVVHSRELERIDILAALGGGRLPESSSAVGT